MKAILVAIVLAATSAVADDGPASVMNDPLLENMVGHWTMAGTAMGKPAHHIVDVQWILNHQFLQIHEVGAPDPKTGKPEYEALPIIGYDNRSDRYVAHWIDVYGGRFSETLGYGTRAGNTINFVFEYPDGPFHTDMEWDAAKSQWHWHMSQKNAAGAWTPFADLTLSRS